MYIMLNGNNGQPLSGLDNSFKNFVTGNFLNICGVPIPNYVWYAIGRSCIHVVHVGENNIWKNMFAVGSNPEAANVSGVSVMWTTIRSTYTGRCMYGYHRIH